MDRFGVDALRFYLLRDVPFGQDGSISTVAFEQRYESELANELGNLASRAIAMVHRYRGGLPVPVAPDDALGHDAFEGLAEEVCALIDRAELTQALDLIWQRVRRLNRYIEERAPWQLAREEGRAGELDRVLSSVLEGLRIVGLLLHAYLPDSAERLLAALAVEDRSLAYAGWGATGALTGPVAQLEALFPKPS